MGAAESSPLAARRTPFARRRRFHGFVPEFTRRTSQFSREAHQRSHREVLTALLHPLDVLQRDVEYLGKARLRPSLGGTYLRDSAADVSNDLVGARRCHVDRGSPVSRTLKNILYDVHLDKSEIAQWL